MAAVIQESSIEKHREGSEVYSGDPVLCRKKSIELLEELHLPRGLLPLDDIEEVGYNRSTGFVWLRQKKKKEHNFKKIGKLVSYANEVTAFVEERRMRRMTGVKSKELLLWVTLSDMYVDDPSAAKITFKTPAGLFRSFPVSAFELEGEVATPAAPPTATDAAAATTDAAAAATDAAAVSVNGKQ